MMNKIIAKCGGAGTGLLLIRLGVGAVFLAHGISKMQNMPGIVAFFGLMGLPAFVAYMVTIVEVVGGVDMILGFFTRVMGVILSIVMLGAIFYVKIPGEAGFIVSGGYEIDLMLFVASLGIVLAGPGKWAVGKHMCGCNDCIVCGTGGHCGCDCNNCTTCDVSKSVSTPTINKDANLM